MSIQVIFTVRNSSFGKVMFLQVSVCPQGGGHEWWGCACMAGVVCAMGHAWQGKGCVVGVCMARDMHGREHVWQGCVW